MKRFEIFLDNTWHDISPLYVPESYVLENTAFNSEYKSSVSSCSFMLYYNEQLYQAVIACEDAIPVRIFDDMELEFSGQMDPVFDASWEGKIEPDRISVECVDFSVKLDENIAQSASYPAVVGGTPYWIYNAENKGMSILYRILEIAGLASSIDKNAPTINQTIKHIAWNKDAYTYREIIDNLLADYGWCLVVRGDRLTWIRTAQSSIDHVEDITPADLTGQVVKRKDYITTSGVGVIWPKTKVMYDALLWRGDLPIGDTSNPRPGEPIYGKDYWPEDSDIIETWQDFGVDYLDVDWLEGKTRLKNEEIALISSSDWVLKDSKDEGVVIDPISDEDEIVYEALRARLRYHNTSEDVKRLYYSQINGIALVKTHKITTSIPEECSKKDEYQATYIYEQAAAERLAQIRYMWLKEGAYTFTFTSTKKYLPGEYYHLHQEGLYDGYVLIMIAYQQDGSETIQYTATSTAPFRALKSSSEGSQGSGNASPGQDGAEYRNVYKRSYQKPEVPTGKTPLGWTFDNWPEGTEPLWVSTAKFDSKGDMQTEWSDPERVSGVPANTVKYAYIRAFVKPAAPVGDNPAGWTINSIPTGYEPIWQSIGQFGETGNLVGAWSEPVRISAEKNGAYRGALSTFPSDPMDEDYILYTGPTTADFTQYHVYKYVAIDDEWIETTESDKIMALQKDALQIAKDTGEVIYAAMLFVDLLVARKLMVGGGTEYNGLLMRVLDDDGTGKPVIEIRNNEQKLFWIDFETGLLYANFAEVVQYLPFTFNDSLDASHPAVFDFFIPEGKIDYVKVRVKAQKYRTYSAVGGDFDWDYDNLYQILWTTKYITIPGHSHSASFSGSSSSAGSHSHSGNSYSAGSHAHSFSGSSSEGGLITGNTNNSGSHSHGISINSNGSHSHSISGSVTVGSTRSETVSFSVPQSIQLYLAHTHSTTLTISESSLASNMTVAWSHGDDEWLYQEGIESGGIYEADITTSGWKSIKVTSSTNGRVQVQIIVKMRINTES